MSYTLQDLPSQARGDTWYFQFLLQDSSGVSRDITSNEYWFTVKSNADFTDAQAELQLGPLAVPANEASQGILNIAVPAILTYNLSIGTYNYDLQEVESTGTVTTLLIGKIRVVADITRTANYVGGDVVSGSIAGKGIFSGETTTTDPTEIFIGGLENARLSIVDNGILAFDALVAGRDTNGDACAFQLYGALKKDTTTTQIIGSVGKNILGKDIELFDANILADDATDSLIIVVTSATTLTTKWTAEVQYTEVNF